MLTFNADAAQKQQLLKFVSTFYDRIGDRNKDRSREKLWWSSRQWCPVGCVFQNGPDCDHRFYADEIGVPVAIAYAERALFLKLATKEARDWWPRFVNAIAVGVAPEIADKWYPALALTVLSDEKRGLINYACNGEQRAAVNGVIELFKKEVADSSAADAAGKLADEVHWKGPYKNRRMEAAEALLQAGAEAVLLRLLTLPGRSAIHAGPLRQSPGLVGARATAVTPSTWRASMTRAKIRACFNRAALTWSIPASRSGTLAAGCSWLTKATAWAKSIGPITTSGLLTSLCAQLR